MKKIAVVLSGSGYLDGSEITESVSLLIALHIAGASVKCFAPDLEVAAINHVTQQPESAKRNVLTEAGRIARGKVESLSQLKVSDFDAVAFPGGFGAAKNLCNWAEKGSQCEVHPEVRRVIEEF